MPTEKGAGDSGGRLKGKPLTPGTYTLRATVGGSSVTTSFTITAIT